MCRLKIVLLFNKYALNISTQLSKTVIYIVITILFCIVLLFNKYILNFSTLKTNVCFVTIIVNYFCHKILFTF